MAHGHAHGHAAGREPGRGTGASLHRAFAIGVAVNLAFVIVEAGYGLLAHSTALLADSVHNLGDVLGLLVAWGVSVLARRKATARHTYGYRSSTILGALGNSLLLLVVVGGLAWEAIERLRAPAPAHGLTILAVAAVGVVVNGVSALLFLRARGRDANVRAAFLHLASDAGVSLGVVSSGAITWKTSWTWVDPVTSLLISVVILVSTWGLLKEAVNLALHAVPAHVDAAAVRAHLAALPGVCDVHDLHIWAMSTTEVALTAHLVVTWSAEPPGFLLGIEDDLRQRFDIDHTTIQLDPLQATTVCPRVADGNV